MNTNTSTKFEKAIAIYKDFFEDNPDIEILRLKNGYCFATWQPGLHRYDFGPTYETLDEFLNRLTAWYAIYLEDMASQGERDITDEERAEFVRLAREKGNYHELQ